MKQKPRDSIPGLWADRRGVSALEYALIVGLLVIIIVYVMRRLGGDLFTLMVKIAILLESE